MANFTVASTPRTFDRQSNEFKDGETLFLRCSVWREVAENVAESLHRGTRVIVSGRLKSRSWDDKETGQKRTVIEMEVDEVGPSLRYATTKVTKTQRGGGGGGFGGSQEDPWSGGSGNSGNAGGQGGWSGGSGGQGNQGGQGGWSNPPAGNPAASGSGQGNSGGWGNAPSYDEPPF